MRWINETGYNFADAGYSLLVAAETWPGPTGDGSAFYSWLDPNEMSPIYFFEMFLWQGFGGLDEALTLDEVVQHESDLITIENTTYFGYHPDDSFYSAYPGRMIDFGVRTFTQNMIAALFRNSLIRLMPTDCKVESAVDNATLDPAYRTYSDFQVGT